MSDTENQAAVTVVPIESLIPDGANVRRRDERAKRSLSASLRQFGAARSIVLDGKDIVRAGNGTLEAAQDAGCTEVLVVEPRPGQLVAVKRSDWSATEATGYSIADNRIGDLASFDDSALAETLRSLQSEDFSLDAVGFTDDEVDSLIERMAGEMTGDFLDRLADAPKGGESGGDDGSPQPGSVPAGYKSLVVVLTDAQDADVREAIKLAKGLGGLETTPEALHRIATEYLTLNRESGA